MFQAIKGYTVGFSLKQTNQITSGWGLPLGKGEGPPAYGWRGVSLNYAKQNPLQELDTEALFSNPGLALQPGLECTMPMVVLLQF